MHIPFLANWLRQVVNNMGHRVSGKHFGLVSQKQIRRDFSDSSRYNLATPTSDG
jgi:hypothetical protein